MVQDYDTKEQAGLVGVVLSVPDERPFLLSLRIASTGTAGVVAALRARTRCDTSSCVERMGDELSSPFRSPGSRLIVLTELGCRSCTVTRLLNAWVLVSDVPLAIALTRGRSSGASFR